MAYFYLSSGNFLHRRVGKRCDKLNSITNLCEALENSVVVIVVTRCLELLLSGKEVSSDILCCRRLRASDLTAACHATFCCSKYRVLTGKWFEEAEVIKDSSCSNQKSSCKCVALPLERKETYWYNLKIGPHHPDNEALRLDVAALF